MPEHTYYEYHCVNCGAPLTPDDVVYDISGIAFFGALPGDYTQFPIYATKEKMETLFSWSEGKGTSIITLFDWISMIYEQCGDMLDPGTREKDADSAYRKFLELLKTQKEQEEYGAISLQVAVIPGLPDNLSRVLVEACSEGEVCRCTIQYDKQYGYSILEFAGRQNKTSYSDHRRCANCHAMILERAFQCAHTLIGFIGFQKVGKTCLIAALCKYLDYAAPGCQLLLLDTEDSIFRREIKKYLNGFSLNQTNSGGTNKINPTIYLEDGEHQARMLTFVDISGEAFDNDEQKFDAKMMESNFRAIAECSLYVFCTALSAFEKNDFGSMQRSLGNFISHITRMGDRPVPSPMLITVMQMDESTNCVINRKDVPYLEEYLYKREYNQIYNVRESEQLKSVIPNETDRKIIEDRLQSFIASVGAKLYYTSITCSAYGRQPVDQAVVRDKAEDALVRKKINKAVRLGKPMQVFIDAGSETEVFFEHYLQEFGGKLEIIEIIKKDENSSSFNLSQEIEMIENSPLRFKPNPRNINLIFDWMMRMIGEREIPSLSKDRASRISMDCRHLSIQDFHTSEMDIQAISRMFVNPHLYDKKFFRALYESPLLPGLKKRSYLAEVAKAKANGESCMMEKKG